MKLKLKKKRNRPREVKKKTKLKNKKEGGEKRKMPEKGRYPVDSTMMLTMKNCFA